MASGAATGVELSRFFSSLELDAVPAEVQGAAARALANIVGVSIGGIPLAACERSIETIEALGGGDQARVIGTNVKGSVDHVALVDGIAAHVLDYDDTELKSVYHPSAPVFGALAPLAEWQEARAQRMLLAWIVGLEVGIRLALALTRAHYDRGWHVTGTAGFVAAAAAASRMLNLPSDQYLNAIGMAATQSATHRIHFGTTTKALHVGCASSGGLMAALLAARGLDANPAALEGRRGMLEVMADDPAPEVLTEGLGEEWRLLENFLKPYACGVVTHPVIDATRELREVHEVTAEDVAEIEITAEPLVLELTGKQRPVNELEAKFSAWHCATVGLLFGRAGPGEFEDEIVTSPETVSLRERISIVASPGVAHMNALLHARLTDGRTHTVRIADARGTPNRPLSDAELREKFVNVSSALLSESRAAGLFTRLMNLDDEPWAALVADAVP